MTALVGCYFVLKAVDSSTACTMREAACQITRVVGREVRVSSELSDQVVICSTPLDIGSLKVIAQCVGGRLREQGGILFVEPDPEKFAASQKGVQVVQQGHIADAVDQRLKTGFRTAKEFESAVTRAIAEERLDKIPDICEPLHMQMLSSIGARFLSQLPLFHPKVWSNFPTKAESSIPPRDLVKIADYRKLERETKELLKDRPKEYWSNSLYSRFYRSVEESHEVGRVQLTVANYGRSFNSTLLIFDTLGQLKLSSSFFVRTPIEPASGLVGDNLVLSALEDSIPLVESLTRSREGDSDRFERAEAILVREPLDLMIGPALGEMARRRGLKLAVPLSDDAVERVLEKAPKTEKEFVDLLASSGVSLQIRDGFLIGALAAPCKRPYININRDNLRAWMLGHTINGIAQFRQESLFASACQEALWYSSLDDWLRKTWLSRKLGRPIRRPNVSPWLLMALGRLDESQWISLQEGKPYLLTGDSLPGRWLLRRTIGGFELLLQRPEEIPAFAMTGTVALEEGLPSDSAIHLNTVRLTKLSGGSIGDMPLALSDIAPMILDDLKNPTIDGISSWLSGKLNVYSEVILEIRVHYGRRFMTLDTHDTGVYDRVQEGVTASELESDLKTELLQKCIELRKRQGQEAATRPPVVTLH